MSKTKASPKRDGTIKMVQEVIETYTMSLTLRQIFYRLVGKTIAGELFINSMNNYKFLSRTLVYARKNDLIDYDKIEDRIRSVDLDHNYHNSNKRIWKRYLRSPGSWIDHYTINKWCEQPYYAIVTVEKDALSGVFSEITNQLGIPLIVNRGYNSLTQLWNLSEEINNYIHNSQKIIFLVFGDFDPTGKDIMRNFREQLNEMLEKHNTLVHKPEFIDIALHPEQIGELHLPPVPAKKGDVRAKDFIAKYGDQIVELDAVDPNILQDWIRKAVKPYFDEDIYNAIKRKETKQKAYLKRKWDGAKEAIDKWEIDNPDDDDNKSYNEFFQDVGIDDDSEFINYNG